MTGTVDMLTKQVGERSVTPWNELITNVHIRSITFVMSYEIFSILTINKKFYKDSGQFYGFFAEKEY
jgi:hypothetical protein